MSERIHINPAYKIEILKALNYHFPNAKIYLFGSRARGIYQEGADVDIAIDIGRPIELHEMYRARVTMENLIIPLKVDLVDMYVVPKELYETILKEGIAWKG